MRRARAALSDQQQLFAAQALARNANKLFALKAASVVLSYIPFGGEISPALTVQGLSRAKVLLPRIDNFRNFSMRFYPATSRMVKNHYNIMEPEGNLEPIPARQIDVVLLPLVAFDSAGNRMGQGGGYYDRAFAHRLYQHAPIKPLLVGVAHHFQQVDQLQSRAWDVPLDAIITDRKLVRF